MFPHQLKMLVPVLHYTFRESQYQYRAGHSQTGLLSQRSTIVRSGPTIIKFAFVSVVLGTIETSLLTGLSQLIFFIAELESDVPSPVEDACTCSTLHIRGGSVYKHYRRCPIHNDTEEHVSVSIQSSTFTDGQSNFVQVDKLPETNCMPEPVENACVCSTLHIQGGSAYKYQKMSNT